MRREFWQSYDCSGGGEHTMTLRPDNDNPPRECRCCRKPVRYGQLACLPHWKMLPDPLRLAIISTYANRAWKNYAANVREADKIWQAAGLWKPGVPAGPNVVVTEKMVDRALKAWFASPPSETDQGLERSMKAALEAALT